MARGQRKGCRVLVLSPTRELATQIADSFRNYGRNLNLTVAVVLGGVSHRSQVRRMERGVDVLVATPGRLNDHLAEGNVLLAEGRYDRRDFVYDAKSDTYVCPAGERLTYRMTTEEAGKVLRRYWTDACGTCALKKHCTPSKQRRVARWENEAVLDRMQARLDQRPDAMIVRRSTVDHPFGAIKAWMGATHFKMKTLRNVATEMALHVLAYNIKRVIAILGVPTLIEAIRAFLSLLAALVRLTGRSNALGTR